MTAVLRRSTVFGTFDRHIFHNDIDLLKGGDTPVEDLKKVAGINMA
jgi:hypothetical protein